MGFDYFFAQHGNQQRHQEQSYGQQVGHGQRGSRSRPGGALREDVPIRHFAEGASELHAQGRRQRPVVVVGPRI